MLFRFHRFSSHNRNTKINVSNQTARLSPSRLFTSHVLVCRHIWETSGLCIGLRLARAAGLS